MLYDPKWEAKTKTEPSLAGLIAWLETHDPATEYVWADHENCVLAQYFTSLGLVYEGHPDALYLENPADGAYIAMDLPHTFGSVLERARAALADVK